MKTMRPLFPALLCAALLALALAACGDSTITHDVTGNVSLDLAPSIRLLEPFGEVGVALDPAIPDEEALFCVDPELGPCIRAEHVRDAALFLLERVSDGG